MENASRQLRPRLRFRGWEQFEERLCLHAGFVEHSLDVDGCCYHLATGDVDADGDADVLSWGTGGLTWYENTLGDGTMFTSRDAVTASEADGHFHNFVMTDLDNDRDLDILAGFHRLNDNGIPGSYDIVWYENTNGTDFGPQTPITSAVPYPGSLFDADVDGDGDADVVWSSPTLLGWFENMDGRGGFGQLPKDVTSGYLVTQAISAGVDSDDDMDVLHAVQSTIIWYETLDGREGPFGPQTTVATVESSVLAFKSMDVGDVDGDGDEDVIATVGGIAARQGSQVVWYENADGMGRFREKEAIAELDGIHSMGAADVDGDGDVDLIVATLSEVLWYENSDNGGHFDVEHVILEFVDSTPSVSTVMADIDGDGYVDFVTASHRDGRLAWYENLSEVILAGDTNGDFQFDQQDIVQVLQTAKYLTGETATFAEGDWNADGVFDQFDIVAALGTGKYLQGPYAADAVFATIRG